MDKRYQVFVSSTYSDLTEERNKVMHAIMELDCFPAGMELFPAIDAEQLEFIKRVIDDCDYYVLIIGGRYGSISEEGISYTEQEYDYAVSKGLPVLAFLHNDINKLTYDKCDSDPVKRKKLIEFRNKVSSSRLVRFWDNADILRAEVISSLNRTMKMYPAIGWVRANIQSQTESIQEINQLLKRIEQLEKDKIELQKSIHVTVENLASINETYTIKGDVYRTAITEFGEEDYIENSWSASLSWKEIISLITPTFISGSAEFSVTDKIGKLLYSYTHPGNSNYGLLSTECLTTIKVQLLALGILDENKIQSGVWKLSNKGYQVMINERAVKSK